MYYLIVCTTIVINPGASSLFILVGTIEDNTTIFLSRKSRISYTKMSSKQNFKSVLFLLIIRHEDLILHILHNKAKGKLLLKNRKDNYTHKQMVAPNTRFVWLWLSSSAPLSYHNASSYCPFTYGASFHLLGSWLCSIS